MQNNSNENLFDTKDIEDIENFEFDSRDRPVYKLNMGRLLDLFKESGEYINAEELRAAYYRKYSSTHDFSDLSLAQVKYLINILNYQHDFKKRGNKFKYNSEPRAKIDYFDVATMFTDAVYTATDAYNIYKEKTKAKNLPKGAFVNTLHYLCQKKCLERKNVNKHFEYSLIDINVLNSRLEKTVEMNDFSSIVQNKNLSFDDVCESLGTTRGKLIGSLKRTGIKWQSRKKKRIRDAKSGKIWDSASDCAKELNVSRQHINQSMKRNSPVKGMFLEFVPD